MKRIIFTFLFFDGQFILSRNFFRQKIGDISWLLKNYNLEKVAYGLDEIMLINISSSDQFSHDFLNIIKKIAQKCFIPITVGGRIKSIKCAESYFKAGADKILINNLNIMKPEVTEKIIKIYGSQAVTACLNYKSNLNGHYLYKSDGKSMHDQTISSYLRFLLKIQVGEVLLQSIDKDGTGNGLDTSVLNLLPTYFPLPVIAMGGIGKKEHFIEGLSNKKIDAVSTANILNFIGSSILDVREAVIKAGISLPEFKKFDL